MTYSEVKAQFNCSNDAKEFMFDEMCYAGISISVVNMSCSWLDGEEKAVRNQEFLHYSMGVQRDLNSERVF